MGRVLMGHLACSYIHTDLYIPLLLLHDNSIVWVFVRRTWVFLSGEGSLLNFHSHTLANLKLLFSKSSLCEQIIP